MNLEDLYPLHNFQIERIFSHSPDEIILQASSQSKSATCPYCQELSERRHSSYQRKPQALPCTNRRIRLLLNVQRYFCMNPACEHKTFAERIPDTVQFYARRTNWLSDLMQLLAFEMSAEAAARVARQMRIEISPDTILRLVRTATITRGENVRVLGIDDWALKKGHNYGTILIDLEKRRPIDLLPDRTKETLQGWLQQHPKVEIITRDRSFEYRLGINVGAPQALQVVDRWHLLHNLREKLQEILPILLKKTETKVKKEQTPTYLKRKTLFDTVKYLAAKGYSQRSIAHALGISRGTVIHYIAKDQVPDWQSDTFRPTQIDPYESYLRKRWQSGCRDVTTLWREIQQLGYSGRRQNVFRFVKRFQNEGPFRYSRQFAWLFLKVPEELVAEERNELRQVIHQSAKLETIYQLVQTFVRMLAQQTSDGFDEWLVSMQNCGIKKLQNFSISIQQDYDAVKASLVYDWSNGQVEGQVNRLKTIKRQMYGRANFDLLRLRVLGPP
jgi:transposase